jgi:2-haloalkanoic acid dehalogenase type II
MAFTQAATIPWTRIKALSFDIFGTLVDWETGIDSSARATALGPYLPERRTFMQEIGIIDTQIQKQHPTMLQRDCIAEGLRQYAKKLKIVEDGKLTQEQVDQACKEYGSKIGEYEAFPDTADAIQRLGKHYKLVPLTNVDNQSFEGTLNKALKGCHFDAIYTAEDVGSYKPDPKNFHYLLDHLKQDFGVEKGDLVHVAQSLFHDHGPAADFQLMSVWVNRSGSRIGAHDQRPQDQYAFQLEVKSLGELATIVDAAFGEK